MLLYYKNAEIKHQSNYQGTSIQPVVLSKFEKIIKGNGCSHRASSYRGGNGRQTEKVPEIIQNLKKIPDEMEKYNCMKII